MSSVKSLPVLVALMIIGLLGVCTANAQNTGCYTLESLRGHYAVVVMYGANVALGLQPEFLDGRGNLVRTGINNQPTTGSTTGERTIGNVTSKGTYTVNCNGTGTITRLVTRPDGTTASTADDFLITGAIEKDGWLIATTIVDAQRDPALIGPSGTFVTRTHTLRPDATAQLERPLQLLGCGTAPPVPSCQLQISVWNYYLLKNINSDARPLAIGDSTGLMTVQQYLEARAAASL